MNGLSDGSATVSREPAVAAPGRTGTEQVILVLGDIICTRSSVITPVGRVPSTGLRWTVTDLTVQPAGRRWLPQIGASGRRETAAPTGEVHVTVESPALQHTAVFRVTALAQVTDIYARVLRARSLGTPAPV